MNKPGRPKKLLDKRIPTIMGLVVLVVALIAGIFFLGDGPGVFAPRATPATTPSKIRITNVTDNSFTVSFLTDERTPGFIKYGTEENRLNSQASDDRDQLTGTVADYQMHHITVRGLQPLTTYYYTLGTGSNASFDNNGRPFIIKTAARNGAPAAAKTIYGSISNQAGNPADGTVVYITLTDAGEMSSLVKASGSWAVPLSNARTKDGSNYAQITDTDTIIISAQGPLASDTLSYNTTVVEAQPVPTLTFGQSAPATPVPSSEPTLEETPEPTEDPELAVEPTPEIATEPTEEPDTSNRSAMLDEMTESFLTTETEDETLAEKTVIDLEKTEHQVVTTSQPKITGKAVPNVTITIEVNSETQIQQQLVADENGNFELDIASLSQNLEPGPHEVSYSYTDPTTGEVISRTVQFTVESPAQQLAQAEPYGSGNPYPPTTTPTPTPEVVEESATESATATESAEATQSAEASDEGRVAMPATDEAIPVSGSIGTTLALVFGGLFFIVSGLWSFWISHQLGKDEVEF